MQSGTPVYYYGGQAKGDKTRMLATGCGDPKFKNEGIAFYAPHYN